MRSIACCLLALPLVALNLPAHAEVTYSILEESKIPGIKRSLDVRLSDRVDERRLRTLAHHLKAQGPRPYKRTFIVYVLPGMTPGAGAWATTHFNPDLEVKIFGFAPGQVPAAPATTSSRVVATWVDEGLSPALLTLERSNGSLILRRSFKDRGEHVTRLQEQHDPRPGRRYTYAKGSDFGEHLRIGSRGGLEFWDQDGHIRTAPRR